MISKAVKKTVIELLKSGNPPRQIRKDILVQYGISISSALIFNWRNEYNKSSDVYVPNHYEFKKLTLQQRSIIAGEELSIFGNYAPRKNNISSRIKDFVIEEIKAGTSTKKIQIIVEEQFDKYIGLSTINWIRKEYIRITGEHIPSYKEFHKKGKFKKRGSDE